MVRPGTPITLKTPFGVAPTRKWEGKILVNYPSPFNETPTLQRSFKHKSRNMQISMRSKMDRIVNILQVVLQ